MAQLTLKDIITKRPSPPRERPPNPLASEVLKKCYSWPTTESKPEEVADQDIDPYSPALCISPGTDREESDDEPYLSLTTSPSRTGWRRSHSLSPKVQEQERFLSHHSPTASPKSRFKRWIEKMEQHCEGCPVLSPEIREIRPKTYQKPVEQSPSIAQRSSPDLSPPPLTPQIEAQQTGTEEIVAELSPLPAAVSLPSTRSRDVHRQGSVRRARNRMPRSPLPRIDEEGDEDKIGLGIRCAGG